MAAQPRYREFVEKLELAAYAAGHDSPIEFIIEKIANGESLRSIAMEVGGMSRWTLWKWITRDEDRYRQYRDARAVGAAALVEEAQEILDRADGTNSAAVVKARNQAGFRQWQAAMQDRRQFGKQHVKSITNNLNIGALHLDTLRKLGGPSALPPKTPTALTLPAEIADAELVE